MKDKIFWGIVALAVWAYLFGASGCAERVLTPAEQLEFASFNIRVQDWAEQCRNDPNQCARGLANMAAEMHEWTLLITGTDPNLAEGRP